MADKDDQDIIKFLIQHEHALNLIMLQIGEQAVLLHSTLKQCEKCKKVPCTVEHKGLVKSLCDRCAAETIVSAGRAVMAAAIKNDADELQAAKLGVIREDDWIDVIDAQKIRTLTLYVSLLRETESKKMIVMH